MKPILFSTPMVKALLNTKPGTWPAQPIAPGRPCKSRTRRVIKPQPEYNFLHDGPIDGEWFWTEFDTDDDMMDWWPSYDKGLSPRYQAGDKLWVRETHVLTNRGNPVYKADFRDKRGDYWASVASDPKGVKLRSPYHLHKEHARLFLEVREVSVERLLDITEADAKAEGAVAFNEQVLRAKGYFEDLWNAINGKGAWESNPWVWVYGLMRVGK